MANPKKEDGYTPISNELLEVIYEASFNATEYKILLFVMRYTFGFSRMEHSCSLNFISKGIGVSKRYVSSTVAKLINDNVFIVVKEHTDTESRVIKLNKNYDTWKNSSKVTQMNNSSTVEVFSNTTGEEQFNTTDEEQFNQDKQNLKQNLKQIDKLDRKPQKHKYGEYSHVSLTDNEKEKLILEFGYEMTDKSITYLDEYIEMKGYKHKSSYLVIKNWVANAVKEKEQKENKQKGENNTTYGEKYDTGNCYTTEYYNQFKSTGE